MTSSRLLLLAARRERLVGVAAAQRAALVGEFAVWQAPLDRVGRTLSRLAWVRRNLRWLVTGGVAFAASPTMRTALILTVTRWRTIRRLLTRTGP